MDAPIRLVIVNDDQLFRQQVRDWGKATNDVEVIDTPKSEEEILHWLNEVRPDVILVDVTAVSMNQVRQMAAQARVIVLHVAAQEPLVLEALRTGAWGHLNKNNIQPSEVVAAVRAVSRGEAVLSPTVAGHILDEVIHSRRPRDDDGNSA